MTLGVDRGFEIMDQNKNDQKTLRKQGFSGIKFCVLKRIVLRELERKPPPGENLQKTFLQQLKNGESWKSKLGFSIFTATESL